MKIKTYIKIGGVIALAYIVGNIRGHALCIRRLVNKYGDDIFGNGDTLIVDFTKRIKIGATKDKKTTEEENNM